MTGQLLPEHIEHLAAHAIPADVATEAGAYSVTRPDGLPAGIRWSGPGLVFMHHALDGPAVPQYRPDTPSVDAEGRSRKYLFPPGPVPLNIVPAMRDRIDAAEVVLIVEGTRQTLCAVAHAGPKVLVIGIAGCNGYSRDGIPNPELGQLGIDGRPVVVAFDADIASNPTVHAAGARLAEHLDLLGAASARFVSIPASATTGLDDYLATVPEPAAVLARLIAKAGKLPRRPKATAAAGNALFDADGLRVGAALDAIRQEWPLLVDQSGRIATYAGGVYRADRNDAAAWDAIITGLLGNAYRSHHARTLTEYAAGRLRAAGLVTYDDPHPGLVNCTNGMLDPLAGELHPHDPAHRSVAQFSVPWEPGAACPTFDGWLPTVAADGLADDLLEATSLILENRLNRGQRRALFLHGPSRSGKSTYLRTIERLVWLHRSAVTMAEFTHDSFAAADLVGALLNSAADLSAAHLEDLGLFKALTGDDPVRAQRKYGQPFTFRARCLFAFSANSIPTASEVSSAYLNRIRPIPFPNTFAGAEDPTIEDRLSLELPGILVRLVEAFQRYAERGGYMDTLATRRVADQFARASDRVRLFLAEAGTADADAWTARPDMLRGFEKWCHENRRNQLGSQKFYALVETAGFRLSKRRGTWGFAGVSLRHSDDWGVPDDEPVDGGQKGQFTPTSLSCEGKTEDETEDEKPRTREKEGETALSAPPVPPADDITALDF